MFHVPEKNRVRNGHLKSDESYGNNGLFVVNYPKTDRDLIIIASDGEGWDHVSVSLKNRTPNWGEMCFVKDLFFDPEDCVIQFHPPESEYVNNHPNCLHMWRPQKETIPTPPSILVGFTKQ